jgi:hypothetical protein
MLAGKHHPFPPARTAPSPFRERGGERVFLILAPTPPANPVREQARSYEKPERYRPPMIAM